jgi:Rps23 Pro-64 3,4-dihydroxylase Tpa1-like proline 4-hydroxylase
VLSGAPVPAPPGPESETRGWPAPFVRTTEFLSRAERDFVLDLALAHQGRMKAATVGGDADRYEPGTRSAWVSSRGLEAQIPWFLPRVREALPDVLPRLAMAPFPPGEIALQMTAHRTGGFYKVHRDSGEDSSRERRVSYVYYFHRMPRRFTGGDLLLYDTDLRNDGYAAAFTRVETVDNSIVFFPSAYCHQVTTVRCETDEFGDGRFTLNGWIHAKAPGGAD